MRKVAVLATHDIILTTLTYMRNPNMEISSGVAFVDGANESTERRETHGVILGDDLLYDYITPPFESVFAGRRFQRFV